MPQASECAGSFTGIQGSFHGTGRGSVENIGPGTFVAISGAADYRYFGTFIGNGFPQVRRYSLHGAGAAYRTVKRGEVIVFHQGIRHALAARKSAAAAVGTGKHAFDDSDTGVFHYLELLRDEIEDHSR